MRCRMLSLWRLLNDHAGRNAMRHFGLAPPDAEPDVFLAKPETVETLEGSNDASLPRKQLVQGRFPLRGQLVYKLVHGHMHLTLVAFLRKPLDVRRNARELAFLPEFLFR